MRGAARLAARFLNAYHYTGMYDFATNGESFALRTFARFAPENPVIWDVGAHHGEYAAEAHEILPRAAITSFEILPHIAKAARRKVTGDWFTLREIGLSDAPGSVDVVWNRRADTTNAIAPMDNGFFAHDDLETVSCPVGTIDGLIAEGAPPPHFLKIDVEGHEPAVLRGAAALLEGADAPSMIQFEYGMTWIGASNVLYDTQRRLEHAGYAVGRLFPDHVAFKDYGWADDDFRMGNMIAVRDRGLRDALS